jgi:hypothetical protein
MAGRLARRLKAITQRRFWTPTVTGAVAGGLLTVTGALGGVFMTGLLRADDTRHDEELASLAQQIDGIERALFEFRLIQSNSLMIGVLAANGAVPADFRRDMNRLMFVLRQGPTEKLIAELNPHDAAAFHRQRSEYLTLLDAALPGRDKATWDALLQFEIEKESKLSDTGHRLRQRVFEIKGDKRQLKSRLEAATVLAFVVQQLGFLIVLLSGLIHQYVHGGSHVNAHPPEAAHHIG